MARTSTGTERLMARLTRHVGPDLPVERARTRTSGYIYGDILVLAAVLSTDDESILHWGALVTVLATMVTTYLAHLLAHAISHQIGRTSSEARLHLRDELRDSVPILSAGLLPAVVMLLGAVHLLPPLWCQIVAAAFVIVRLATMGIVVERMTGEHSTLALIRSGIGLAILSVAIVVVKIALVH